MTSAGWRKLRVAALVLRLLRTRRSCADGTTAHSSTSLRDFFPFEPAACCALKKTLLTRIVAKPFYCRSDVDVKLLAEVLRQCRFSANLSSASSDALARALHFRVVHDGEVLFREGDAIEERSTKAGSASDDCSNRLGECVGTCGPGASCGEDAITGSIVRKTTALAQTTTLVAFVTQTDYLRIARFNVEAEVKVLDDVRQVFMERTPHSSLDFRLDSNALRDGHTGQVIKRFLHRYECFRMVSEEFLLEFAQRLQFHAFEPGDRLVPTRDGVPKMYFILSGECCVHVLENTEMIQLKGLSMNQKCNSKAGISTSPSEMPSECTYCICCSELRDQTQGVSSFTHMCTLKGGDAFGESSILSSSPTSKRVSFENVILSLPRTSSDVCYAVSLSIDDYLDVRLRYQATTAFTAVCAHSILLSKLPRDRTCEQLDYLVTYLAQHSPAKLFFTQLSPGILRLFCLHATLEQYTSDTKLLACIQEQGKTVKCFRVVLDGSVRVFKTHDGSRRAPVPANTRDGPAPNKQVNTPTVESRQHTKTTLEDAEGSNQQVPCSKFVEPASILCHGSAFGLLPLLLDSPSPVGYVAYISAKFTTTNIISISASAAKLYLGASDEHLVCHPVRALQQTIRSTRTTPRLQLTHGRKWQAMKEFERPVLDCPAVSGIPRPKLKVMIDNMVVVHVPARHYLFETGDATKGCIFIVLDGCARTFRCPIAESKGDTTSSTRLKGGAKEESNLMRMGTEDFAEEAAKTPEQSMFAFTKPLDDDFYSRDYKYVRDFSAGGGFGRHGAVNTHSNISHQAASKRRSSKLSLFVRRASHRFQTRPQSTIYSVYPETAITISNCCLGILWSDTEEVPKSDSTITADLNGPMRAKESCKADGSTEQPIFLTLSARYQVLERMGLTKRLNTFQLFRAAQALRYVEVEGGETVYRNGEEGIAMYFIVSGQVRLFNGRERSTSAAKSNPAPVIDDFWSIDLCEGEVFGSDLCFGGISQSSRHLTNALAVKTPDSTTPTGLVYLMVDDYLAVLSPWKWFSQDKYHSIDRSLLYTRTSTDRWKYAVFQVTRARPTWSSVIERKRACRTELTLDMVHDLPVFKDIGKQQSLEICKQCLVEIAPVDTVIFERGDKLIDGMVVVVAGSVTIQQQLSSPLMSAISPTSSGLAKVSIRVLKPGDSFGEVELILDASTHLVDAIVSSASTKLLRVPKSVFFSLWPQRVRQEFKLQVLKRAFPLDLDQLGSLYYSVNECSFKRNDVVFKNNSRGTLVVIERGVCVMRDCVILQQKRPRKSQRHPLQAKPCPPKLALDAAVASLGPSTILYSEALDPIANMDVDSLNQAEIGGYIIADSPEVNTLSVQLYHSSSGSSFSRRHQDLLVLALFGRRGLQTLRTAISVQHNRRADSTAHSIRLAVTSAPKDQHAPLLSSPASPLKRILQETNSELPRKLEGRPMQMELTQYLRNRQLPQCTHKSKKDKISLRQFSGIAPLMGPRMMSPSKPTGFSIGSFTKSVPTASGEGVFPALRQAGPSNRFSEAEIQPYVDPAVVASSMRGAQLIKETRVIAELCQQLHKKTLGPKISKAMETRQRHGRPPSRQLESRDWLVDVLTPDTNFENERKRSGLCRELLHIKCSEDKLL